MKICNFGVLSITFNRCARVCVCEWVKRVSCERLWVTHTVIHFVLLLLLGILSMALCYARANHCMGFSLNCFGGFSPRVRCDHTQTRAHSRTQVNDRKNKRNREAIAPHWMRCVCVWRFQTENLVYLHMPLSPLNASAFARKEKQKKGKKINEKMYTEKRVISLHRTRRIGLWFSMFDAAHGMAYKRPYERINLFWL